MTRIAAGAAEKCPDLAEWQDPGFHARSGFELHRGDAGSAPPSSALDLRAVQADHDRAPARRPMTNCWRARSRSLWCVGSRRRRPGASPPATGAIRRAIESRPALQARPTARRKAVADIHDDMEKPERMLRLLQGDVGSGKTAVALMAMAAAVRGQAAIGDDGADRNPRPPACRATCACLLRPLDSRSRC